MIPRSKEAPILAGRVQRLTIDDWRPVTVNELLRGWRAASRMKKAGRDLIAAEARRQGIVSVVGPIGYTRVKRRVSLEITYAKGQRSHDPDAFWKTTLDALVAADLLMNDTHRWCEQGSVTILRGERRRTVIILEDLP